MPKPRVPDPAVTSTKELVHLADELTDAESVRVFEIATEVQNKYAMKTNSESNLEALRDEVLTRLMEMGVLAEFDPTPCFYGESPILEIRGKISGDSIHNYGFDHEKKAWEVNKAHERGEDYLGEKESSKSRREK